MKVLHIILQIAILYGFYSVGVWIQESLNLFIPGSIIGMILLFCLLVTKVIKPVWIETGAHTLMKDMPLLFLPVTIGIVNHLDLFVGKGLFLIAIVLISTAMVMICSGHITQVLLKRNDIHE
ncbi:CidA/LrgA family holin-like protein [Aquibacillus koreensis]|uniref:CidA/LrgA family holin-like protein n=1 Tax=Aquibacillus koreensis TaxID=279446 RepID=A0A9X3WQE2_9BACI|nr:CidA/LrgA family holin-like protein [Aquibacillus koreensis]MCT2534389.1 CidA/LrgA family holin-like protein [Aquibacillus koreensis]MDC3421696.1 CidA/LrgA family holin-like protein [Aquibacillus koreensis]